MAPQTSTAPRVHGAIVAVAIITYTSVIIALTTLKSFFQIGLLWDPNNQRVRKLMLEPLELLREETTTFAVIFEYGGNISFFIPWGAVVYVALVQSPSSPWKTGHGRSRSWRAVAIATLLAAALSLSIEISQYIFALGRSSTDDFLANTLGGVIGAAIAALFGPRAFRLWCVLAIVSAVVCGVLVLLGDSLGDPDKVVSSAVSAADAAVDYS